MKITIGRRKPLCDGPITSVGFGRYGRQDGVGQLTLSFLTAPQGKEGGTAFGQITLAEGEAMSLAVSIANLTTSPLDGRINRMTKREALMRLADKLEAIDAARDAEHVAAKARR